MLSLTQKGIFCLHSLEVVEDDSSERTDPPQPGGASQMDAIKELIRGAQAGTTPTRQVHAQSGDHPSRYILKVTPFTDFVNLAVVHVGSWLFIAAPTMN